MTHEFRIAIASSADAQADRRRAFEAIARLNERFAGRVVLAPGPIPSAGPRPGTATDIPADASANITSDATSDAANDDGPDDDAPTIALALAWNEADDGFESALTVASGAAERLLFTRTDPVPLALDDRDEVLRRLGARERLDDLLHRHAEAFRVVAYADDVSVAVERELTRIVDARLGIGSGPVDLRPRLDGTWLERPRLLRRLPDTPGHVVVLEAPYGSGKSVLAAQWAASLEAEGVRVAWTPPADADAGLTPRLARAVGIAADTPAALVRERLWETPTLVVVEDLPPDADLDPLLKDPGGFVLLAGREPLRDEGLEKLARAGRVTRLGANELAFTRAEAEGLVGDAATAATLHAGTIGWALPLHVAALTGATPDPGALLAGLRASLPDSAWRELLFLAALPYLPLTASRSDTDLLVANGFVQALGNAHRLHPWLAELVSDRHRDDVADAVREHAVRLPLPLRGDAYERTRDAERLAEVLVAAVDAETWREAPTRLIAWDAAVDGFADPRRDWAVGAAHQRLGEFGPAIARLSLALEAPAFGPATRLAVARELMVPLGVTDPKAGYALLERAEAWIPHAEPEVAARFLGNSAILHAHASDFAAAIATTERSLTLYPADSPHRVGSEVNLALFRWDLHGDFDARLHGQLATLDRIADTYAVQALGQCRDLGMFHAWLGDWAAARRHLARAAAGVDINPPIATEALAALAYLDGDRDAVGEQLRRAMLFPNPYVGDMVSMYRILLDLEAGDPDGAARTFERSPRGPFAASAHARVMAANGEVEAALALIDENANSARGERLYLTASRYLITRDASDLEAFLTTTTAGARLLPGFLPLDTLPSDTALAAHYPIEELLRSGRVDAIAAREAEVPPLHLDVLGEFEARVLGRAVDLTGRQRHILALLLLGLPRHQVAEAVWPETDAKKQRNNLNVQLAALRKILEPWGLPSYLGEHGLRHVESDHRMLLAALDAGDVVGVHARYREPFAPGVDLSPVEEERARLRERVVAALYEASDEAPASEPWLLRILELESLHEEALQRLLRGLLRRGRRREALGRYRAFEARLRDELDLEPLPETRALLAGRPVSDA